jgi:hypothetical protein
MAFKMKKAQMEMIGLVIIVILITLGMLFMAQFALKSEPKKKIFVRKGLAYSTMSALMKSSADCQAPGRFYEQAPTIGGDLIKDCANYPVEDCETEAESYSFYQCQGKNSCCFLKDTISNLLEETLGRWNKHYEFRSVLLSGPNPERLIEIIDRDNRGCRRERDSSGSFPLNTDAGIVENILYLCD